MGFKWWQINRIMVGISHYGLGRTLTGLVALLRLKINKPKKGSVTTKRDQLRFNFMYPEQFSYSLVLFQDLVEPEFELLRQILTRDAVFFDVGGAIGTYSLFAAKIVDGPVHTFEPVAENIATLKENLCLNQVEAKVKVNAVALSDEEGFGQIQRGETFFYSHLQEDVSVKETVPTLEDVRVTTLGGYCLQHKISHIDVLKIDTEGHTAAILRGAQTMLTKSQIDLLIVELDRELEEIYTVLTLHGYECFAYDVDQKSLLHIAASGQQIFAKAKRSVFHSNVIFIHQTALTKYQNYVTVKM